MIKLFEDGIAQEISRLLASDKCEGLFELLTSPEGRGRANSEFLVNRKAGLDQLQKLHGQLPSDQRRLFCIFAEQIFGVAYNDIENPENNRHPFVQIYRDATEIDSEAAQDYLIGLYDRNLKTSFAIAFSYYVRQLGASFVDELSYNEKFNKFAAVISEPSGLFPVYVTPLVLVVDNSDVAPVVPGGAGTIAGATRVPSSTEDELAEGVDIISSDGIFGSLAKATQHTLARMPVSFLYGPYGSNADAALHYDSLIMLHAEVLRVIKTGSNYFGNAVQRVQYQKDHCSSLYHGGLFGQRFLKDSGYPDWAEAIWNHESAPETETDAQNLSQTLTRYALFNPLNRADYYVGGENKAAFLSGFVDALIEINEDLWELGCFDDEPSPALARYEETWGFHSDLAILETGDKKRAAYYHLANIVTGAFGFHDMTTAFRKGTDTNLTDFHLRDELPIDDFFENFLTSHSHVHAFRIINFFRHFAIEESDRLMRHASSQGMAFFNIQRLRATDSAPPRGYNVPICFDQNEAYIMPPFTNMRFVHIGDLAQVDISDIPSVLNIDYALLALRGLQESGGQTEQGNQLIQGIIDSTREKALKHAEGKAVIKISSEMTFSDIYKLNYTSLQMLQARGDTAHEFPQAARASLGKSKSSRPTFWRAARVLDMLNKLRPKR